MNGNNSGNSSSGGMGSGGGMGNACYTYPDAPATPGKVTPDVTFNRSIYMDGTFTADDGRNITVWGFNDGGGGGMGGMGGQFPSPAI